MIGGGGLLGDVWDEFRNETAPVRFDDPASRLTTAAGTRSDTWDAALDAFSTEPLKGSARHVRALLESARPGSQFLRDAHSLYLEVLAEYGILGLLAILVALGGGLVLAIESAITPPALSGCRRGGGDDRRRDRLRRPGRSRLVLEETALSAFGLAAIGIVLAADAGRITRRAVPRGARIAAVVVAVLAVATQVPGLISTARVREANDALVAGRTAEALELANKAIDAEPWSSSAYLQRAAVRAADGDPHAARADVREAIERDREFSRHGTRVQIDLLQGDQVEAAARRRARSPQAALGGALRDLEEFARDPVIKASTVRVPGAVDRRLRERRRGRRRPLALVEPPRWRLPRSRLPRRRARPGAGGQGAGRRRARNPVASTLGRDRDFGADPADLSHGAGRRSRSTTPRA